MKTGFFGFNDFDKLIYGWAGINEPKFERVFRQAITKGRVLEIEESYLKIHPWRGAIVKLSVEAGFVEREKSSKYCSSKYYKGDANVYQKSI